MVPWSSTFSGMMLRRSPPRMIPTVTTLGVKGERFRLRMVCRASTAWAAITTGSTDCSGAAPWAVRPIRLARKDCAAAIAGPGV